MSYDFTPAQPREGTVRRFPPVTWQETEDLNAAGTPLPEITRETGLTFITVKAADDR